MLAYSLRILTCRYINRRNEPIARAFFPRMQLVTMDTGHWCQAEQPREFMQHVQDFLAQRPE